MNGVKFGDKHSITDWDLLMTSKNIGDASDGPEAGASAQGALFTFSPFYLFAFQNPFLLFYLLLFTAGCHRLCAPYGH